MPGVSQTDYQSILIVRVGLGGDLIMTTPAVDSLLAAFPGAEFHLLTTGDGRRIMSGYHERITKTFLYSRRFPHTLFMQRKLFKQFKAEGYERIYIFETKPHYQKWLGGLAPKTFAMTGDFRSEHYSDRCLDLVADSVDTTVARGWLNMPVTEQGIQDARSLLADHGIGPELKLVGLHPTFSGTGLPLFRERVGNRHRMWPGQSFAELARILVDGALVSGLKLAVVIDALPQELKYVEPIIAKSEGAITLLAAPPDFQRYKGLVSLMDVLVTPNTGPMHLAAALKTPLIALFSNWSPSDCGPFMDPDLYKVLRAEDSSQPERCLAAIEPPTVAEAVLELIKRRDNQ